MDTNEVEGTILSLAKQIGEAQKSMAGARVNTATLQANLDARKLFVTPLDGWEGKNEAERRVSAETTFAGDKQCQQLREELSKSVSELATTEATLASLEAERRGLEWVITNRLVNALHDRWDGLNPGRVLSSKIATSRAREEALDKLGGPQSDRVDPPIDDELPF